MRNKLSLVWTALLGNGIFVQLPNTLRTITSWAKNHKLSNHRKYLADGVALGSRVAMVVISSGIGGKIWSECKIMCNSYILLLSRITYIKRASWSTHTTSKVYLL